MKDTPIVVEARLRAMWMSRPGSERLAKGCAMFDDAKALALAGLRARNVRDARELRRLLFVQIYGNDFPKTTLQKILGRI